MPKKVGCLLKKFGGTGAFVYFCSIKTIIVSIMKKIAIVFLLLVSALTTSAEGFSYLTFELTDGSKVSVDVTQLTLAISGNTLKAGSLSFTLTNLSKMYFSNTNETTTVIEDVEEQALSDFSIAEVYDLNGRRILNGSSMKGRLPQGVYIVKTREKTYKMMVR